jgi:predicted Ser/Thr protein kinase
MAGALTKTGRYQIVSELGRGSMGVVYQGFDPVIGRTVAIKTMLTEGLAPQEFQEYKARFQREAQAAGVLTHPSIVTVYDFGEDNGILYLAMEFLEGKSLEKIVEEQNVLPIETIIPIYDQVCGALDNAHLHKIVHRDIKPANIMILESGLVKVTDFGIAKMMSMGMTQAGQILGTPNYMSPEQVKGRPVDGRSDIFSLGVILYELVTGEKPFGGQNITTVIYKIINENPIPPRELDATIHPGLSYVISKALAKSPDERYQTCRELADDLRNYKNLGGQTAPSATVVIKVPPIQPVPAEPVAAAPPPPVAPRYAAPPLAPQPTAPPLAEQPPARQVSVQVIPPVQRHPQGTSPVVWVLLTLLIVAVLGGGGYFFLVLRNQERGKVAGTNAPPVTQPAPQGATTQPAPATNAPAETPTAGPQPSQPAAAATPTEAKPEQELPKGQVEPTRRSEEAHGVTIPTPGGTARSAPAPKFGQLLVNSNLQGARISLDGRSEPGWVTPHTFPDLPAGTHMVVISKEGYEDVQQSVAIEGGRTNSVTAELTVPSGEVTIVTNPPGAEVFIDGRSVGPSPARATVTVGEHKYTIRRPGMEPYESTFTMKNGAILTKRVNLGGEAIPTGIVEVRTIPPGATVYADGSQVGSLTPTSFRLSAGHHTLRVSLPGRPPVQRDIDVSANGSAQVNIDLSRQ